MRLNHIDLAVRDIAQTRAFFEAHLDFTHVQTLGQNGLAILKDETGLVLVLSRWPKDPQAAYPGAFHIGFLLESEAAVWARYDRLLLVGVNLPAPPEHQRGGFQFYFEAPGPILIEIGHRPLGT
jgi:catechol 2,3-dioxygenase-like lactoylglutathione lyase family enzyme